MGRGAAEFPFHPFADSPVSVVALGVKLNQGLRVLEHLDERYACRRLAPSSERRQSAQGAKPLGRLEILDCRCVFALNYSEANDFWFAIMPPRDQHDVALFDAFYAWSSGASELGADLAMAPFVRIISHEGRAFAD